MRHSLVLVLLFACGEEKEGENTTTTEDSADSGGTTTTTTTTTEAAEGELQGTVTRPGGAPFAQANLQLCRGADCRAAVTDDNGEYSFSNLPESNFSFQVPGDGVYPTILTPVTIGTSVLTQDIIQPMLDAATALPAVAEEIEVGAGLYITVGIDSELEGHSVFDPEATEVAGVAVEEAHWVPVLGASTVHAQWHLHPWDYHNAEGIPARIQNTFGFADGETYEVWVSSYEASDWLNAGTVTVDGDWLEGANLGLLSTVALVSP